MPNSSSDQLYQLIKSLSKAEKRNFKLFVSRNKNGKEAKFLILFDLIDKQKSFSEESLKKDKSIKATQLSNLKSNLYKQILKSLRTINSEDDIDISIRELMDYTKILYNKCLYSQCMKMLEKAKQLASTYERVSILLEINEFERNLVSNYIKSNIDKKVKIMVDESEELMEKFKNIHTFSNLSLTLYSFYLKIGYIRDHKDFEIANSFLYSTLPIFKEELLSAEEKSYLYQSLVSYYFFIQDFNRAYDYSKKWISLFDNNQDVILSKPETYLRCVNNLLKAQSKLNKFDEFIITLNRFKGFKIIMKNHMSYNIKLVLFKYYSINLMNQYFMKGNFTQGVKEIPAISNELENYSNSIDKHNILIFYYKFACMHFGQDDYQAASFWLTKIINTKVLDLRSDIHCFARILNLICHYELENLDLIDYHIKSTYRFLIKMDDMYTFQRVIIKFLRKLSSISQDQLTAAFKELHKQLTPLTKDPYEKRAFIYFDIISWLESKFERESVQKIIQKKTINE